MSLTRTELRLWVGELIGDVRQLTATANGSTTTFVDLANCAQQDDSLIGRFLYFTSGANSGLSRRVTDSTETTGTLTFAAVTSTVAGDTAELWNDRNTGVLPTQVHNALNRAITSIERDYLTEVSADYSFDAQSPVVSLLQSSWVGVVKGAEWIDEVSGAHRIPSADVKIDRANRTFELLNMALDNATGRTVRIRGYTVPSQLSADSSTTTVDGEWLVHQAAAWVLGAVASKRADARDARAEAVRLQARADLLRPAIGFIPIGSTVML